MIVHRLHRTSEVLKVLRAGGYITHCIRPGTYLLRNADGKTVLAWQAALIDAIKHCRLQPGSTRWTIAKEAQQ